MANGVRNMRTIVKNILGSIEKFLYGSSEIRHFDRANYLQDHFSEVNYFYYYLFN